MGCTPVNKVTQRQTVLNIALRMGGPGQKESGRSRSAPVLKFRKCLSALLVGKHARFRALTILPSCHAILYARSARQVNC